MALGEKQTNARRIALLGIFTAIILIQNFVPFLGNIPFPPLNPTIIQLTVIVATFMLGTKDGMIIGAIWGIVRMIRAYTMPASSLDPYLWTHPMIALVPRVLIGLFTGGSYQLLKKGFPSKEKWNLAISAIIGSLTNTVFVLLFIYIFQGATYAYEIEVDVSNLLIALAGVVATNGVAEAIVSAIVAPLIVVPLRKRQQTKTFN